MRALHGQRFAPDCPTGFAQAPSQAQRQIPHAALRLEHDAWHARHGSGRSEDAWKRRPRKGCTCEQHSGDCQLSQQSIATSSKQRSSPSQMGHPAAPASTSSSDNRASPASSLQCRTGLPTQGDMVVSGTGDEFAGLQVAERPDTSRNSDVDYLAVRRLATPPSPTAP